MEGKVWPSVSPAAKDMLTHMLEVDPKKRWSATELLQHPWFRENLPKASAAVADAAGDVVASAGGGDVVDSAVSMEGAFATSVGAGSSCAPAGEDAAAVPAVAAGGVAAASS